MNELFKINTKLRDEKDHFVVTVYKQDRRKMNLSLGDIVVLNIMGLELIRPVNKDFHLSIPKKVLAKQLPDNNVTISILKIAKKKDCVVRPKNMMSEDKLDIRYFVPKETIFGNPICLIPRGKHVTSLWYSIGGGVAHITIRNFIELDAIAELLGFYFGDGSTSSTLRSFRLTNSEASVLRYCLSILDSVGIKRSLFKIQIIYSTPNPLTADVVKRCSDYWSDQLEISEKAIVSVAASRGVRESLPYGSARVYFDNSVLTEVFLHGLLPGILNRILNPSTYNDCVLAKGFLRGLLAAEGCVTLNKHKSVVKVGIAFDPHSEELNLYKRLLTNLGITYCREHNNELNIGKYGNFKKLYEFDAFKMHARRKEIFLTGFLTHRFSKKSTRPV